ACSLGSAGLLIFAALESDFVPDYITEMTAYLQTFSEEDIEAIGKEIFERNLSLLPATHSRMLAISYLGQGLLIGKFVSIIVSVILRKQPKTPGLWKMMSMERPLPPAESGSSTDSIRLDLAYSSVFFVPYWAT